MKIYIAGPAPHRAYIDGIRAHLERHGHQVVSTWHSERDTSYAPATLESRMPGCATKDYNEVMSCDALMCMSLEGTRGGMHTELGLALAWDKIIFLIGDRTQVFHWHHRVNVYKDLTSWTQKHS